MPRGDPWTDLRGNQSSICAIVLTGEASDWNERSDSVEERSLRERCFVGSLGWGLGLALPSQGELMGSPWLYGRADRKNALRTAAKQFFGSLWERTGKDPQSDLRPKSHARPPPRPPPRYM